VRSRFELGAIARSTLSGGIEGSWYVTIETDDSSLRKIVSIQLNIDDALLQEALALDEQVSIDALLETALREYIERRKRLKVLELFGTIDYDEDYDYKQQRQRT